MAEIDGKAALADLMAELNRAKRRGYIFSPAAERNIRAIAAYVEGLEAELSKFKADKRRTDNVRRKEAAKWPRARQSKEQSS